MLHRTPVCKQHRTWGVDTFTKMYTAGFVCNAASHDVHSSFTSSVLCYSYHLDTTDGVDHTSKKKKKKKSKMTQIATPQAIEKQLNDSGYHTTDWDAEIIQYHNHNMYVLRIIIYVFLNHFFPGPLITLIFLHEKLN